MKDLIFSIGRFCENHVEKVVLVLVSLVCAWLFFTRVIFSPNVVELDGNRAPITVSNFVTYVRDGHYDGTIFHRVIPGFVAQAGGYVTDYEVKPTRGPIPNESGNGLTNDEGTIAMARQNPPHTATSQFYINLADNDALNPNPRRWGYTVFGQVVEGMDVLAAIAAVPTGSGGPFPSDVPQAPIIIESARLLEE